MPTNDQVIESYEHKVKTLLARVEPSTRLSEQDASERKRLFMSRIGMYGLLDMHEYSTIPEFFNHLEFEADKSIDDTKKYLLKLVDRESKGDTAYWFIRLLDTGKIIGTLGVLDIDFETRSAELGKGLSPKYWGGGYMSEAFSMYLEYCFNVLELNRLWSVTSVENEANIKLMRKFGFEQEKELKNFYTKHDGRKYSAALLGQSRKKFNQTRL